MEKLQILLDDALHRADPTLASVNYLHAQPMAAFDVYLNRRIPSLPRGHVNLVDSKYGLSFIDVSQFWPGYDTTVLNLIASDFTLLERLSREEATAELLADLQRFLPLQQGDVRKVEFIPNLDEPLFMNEVGIWPYRPSATTALPNLFLAGDYCRSPIDLVSMEGAISTGLIAAEALRADAGIAEPVPILQLERPRRWLTVAGRKLLLPVAALAKTIVWWGERQARVRA
jgi:hypothetical protein